MQTPTQTSNIGTILASGHTSTITRNLAFPLRTTVHLFCEGPTTTSPPRVLPRGDFRQMATFAYADDAEDDEASHAQADTGTVADDEEEEGSKGVKSMFMTMLLRLQALIRGVTPTRDGQAPLSGA